jgi:hypothetical protein
MKYYIFIFFVVGTLAARAQDYSVEIITDIDNTDVAMELDSLAGTSLYTDSLKVGKTQKSTTTVATAVTGKTFEGSVAGRGKKGNAARQTTKSGRNGAYKRKYHPAEK